MIYLTSCQDFSKVERSIKVAVRITPERLKPVVQTISQRLQNNLETFDFQ